MGDPNVNFNGKRPRPDGSGVTSIGGDNVYIKRVKVTATPSSISRTQILQDKDGTIALTSDIVDSSNVVTLNTNQTITGKKTFSSSPEVASVTNGVGTISFPPSTGTVALIGDTVTLSSAQTIAGKKTFSSPPEVASVTNGVGTISFPTTTGTVALTSNVVDLTSAQSIAGSKTFNGVINFPNTALSAACNIQFLAANTGIRSGIANELRITTAGTDRVIVTNTALQSAVSFRALSGSAATPAYSFSGDTNTGLFLVTNDVLGTSINGVAVKTLNATSDTSSVRCNMPSLGLTNGGFSSVLSGTLTANRTLTIPDSNGTIALTSGVVDLTNDQSNILGYKIFGGAITSINQFGLYESNISGCTMYSSSFTPGLGGFRIDTASQSTGFGILKLPSIASSATYTFPSVTGTLLCNNASINQLAGDLTMVNTGSNILRFGSSPDPIGSNTYGLAFGPAASGGAFNIFGGGAPCMKLGVNADSQVISFWRNNPGAVQVGSIAVTTTATSYNTISDRKAKKNIVELSESKRGETAVDQLNRLKVYEYEFKEDDSFKSVGFIADEVVSIFPEAVTLAKTTEEYDMIDYSKMVPFLLAAVQELSKEVKQLKKLISKE